MVKGTEYKGGGSPWAEVTDGQGQKKCRRPKVYQGLKNRRGVCVLFDSEMIERHNPLTSGEKNCRIHSTYSFSGEEVPAEPHRNCS